MAHQARIFRIFVSSTFDDMKAERDALQRDCFPRLRELCAERGARFQAIDLRWGVSQEAAFDQQTLPICLGEIERCRRVTPRPNFIALLGNRYGWCPLPAEIRDKELMQILSAIEDRADRSLVEEWYRKDNNAVPPIRRLKVRSGEWQDAARWGELEARLHSILERATVDFDVETRAKFVASATMQEIEAGAMGAGDASDHVFAFIRKIRDLPDDDSAAGYRETDASLQQRLGDLKRGLRARLGDHVHEYESTWLGQAHDPPISLDHLDQLCNDVYLALEAVILRQLEEIDEQGPLDQEIAAHSMFATERTRFFVGRTDALKRIDDYLKQDSDRAVLVVNGHSGCGKTALLARAALDAAEIRRDATHVNRFIGVTPAASNGRELLESLCHQIGRIYGVEASTSALDDLELGQIFRQKLALATRDKPLVLFLDALDQLRADDPMRNLGWLPVELPEHVKLIVSVLPVDSGSALAERIAARGVLELDSMPMAEGEALLDRWLDDAGRTLTPPQREAVLRAFRPVGLPLYLRLLFEEVRLWQSSDPVPDIPDDIQGMIRQLFNRLSDRANHGPVLVSRALAYLAASRNGLSEDEILDLLAVDDEVYDDFFAQARHDLPAQTANERRIPVVVWSRLRMDLEPYLSQHSVDGALLLGFYHRQIEQMAREIYLTGEGGIRTHRMAAEYFSGAWRKGNIHALEELPYQQQSAYLWEDLQQTLTDIEFLQCKIERLSAARVIQDYERAIAELQRLGDDSTAADLPGLRRLRDAIRLSLAAVTDDAMQLRSQLVGRLGRSGDPAVKAVIDACLAPSDTPWLKPLSRHLTAAGTGQQRSIAAHATGILALAASADLDKAISTAQDGSIKIWRLDTGEEIQRLQGHHDRVDCVAVDRGWRRAVSGSSDGTLKVWDLGSGAELFSCTLPSWIGDVCMTADGAQAVVRIGDDITLWELEGFSQLLSLSDHADAARGVCLMENDRYVIAVSSEGVLRRWDLDRGESSILFDGMERPWRAAATPRANRVVAASSETIYVYDFETGSVTHVMGGHDKAINALAVTDDGRVAFSGGIEGDIKVWDLDSGAALRVLRGHTNAVSALSVSEDGKRAVSASWDGTIRTWDLAASGDERMLHQGELCAVAVSAELGRGVSASVDESIDPEHILDRVSNTPPAPHVLKVWDLNNGKYIGDLIGHGSHPARGSGVCEAVVTHDGQWLVSGGADGTLRVWSLESGQLLHILEGSVGSVKLIRTSADGHTVVAEDGHDLLVWHLAADTGYRINSAHSEAVSAIAVTTDGRFAVSASHDRLLKVWDLEQGRELATLRGHEDSVKSVVITQDGRRAVSASWDKTVRVWDIGSGEELCKLAGHTHWVTSVAIVPEGTIAASAAHDNTVRLWEPPTGFDLGVLEGHRDTVNKVRFTRNGDRLWSISRDHTLKVWDWVTGACVATFTAEGPLEQLAVTPDGVAIVAEGDTSGLVHIVKLEET